MFHVEMRQGSQVARQFNMSGPELDRGFLAPLMADRDFTFAGHEWTPRRVRIRILEGAELQSHELALGRAWQNAERGGTDVTREILARARAAAAGAQ